MFEGIDWNQKDKTEIETMTVKKKVATCLMSWKKEWNFIEENKNKQFGRSFSFFRSDTRFFCGSATKWAGKRLREK